jgi:hypothetical protein
MDEHTCRRSRGSWARSDEESLSIHAESLVHVRHDTARATQRVAYDARKDQYGGEHKESERVGNFKINKKEKEKRKGCDAMRWGYSV